MKRLLISLMVPILLIPKLYAADYASEAIKAEAASLCHHAMSLYWKYGDSFAFEQKVKTLVSDTTQKFALQYIETSVGDPKIKTEAMAFILQVWEINKSNSVSELQLYRMKILLEQLGQRLTVQEYAEVYTMFNDAVVYSNKIAKQFNHELKNVIAEYDRKRVGHLNSADNMKLFGCLLLLGLGAYTVYFFNMA